MTSSFLLLRLPFLALAEVVQQMDLLQTLYLTCFTSRNANFLTKTFTKKIAIELKICHHYGNQLRFRMVGSSNEMIPVMIFDPKDPQTGPKKPPRSTFYGNFGQNLHVPGFMFKGKVWTCWNDISYAFRTMMSFFATNFTVQTASFVSNGDEEGREVNILRHAKQLGFHLSEGQFQSWAASNKEGREALSILANVEHLIFDFRDTLKRFTFPAEEFQKFTMQSLLIYSAHWVTLEHVCAMVNIPVVRLVKPSLSNNNINIILKKWISNSLNFGKMIIDPSNYNKKEILQGIDAERVPDEHLSKDQRGNMFKFRRADNTIGGIEFRGYDIIFWVVKEQD